MALAAPLSHLEDGVARQQLAFLAKNGLWHDQAVVARLGFDFLDRQAGGRGGVGMVGAR